MSLSYSWIPIAALALSTGACLDSEIETHQNRAAMLAVQKTYALVSANARLLAGGASIAVRAKDWTLAPGKRLRRVNVANVDQAALSDTLRALAATLRPAWSLGSITSPQHKRDVLHFSQGTLRGWAHKASGFLSVVDTRRDSQAPRRLFSAAEAVDAVLEQLGAPALGLGPGQTIDVVAVEETRGVMVDAKTKQPMWVRYPGGSMPTKSHTVSYRVLFGRRQDGVPILGSTLAAAITPQGRLIEVSRFWRALAVDPAKTESPATMPKGVDSWIREGLTREGVVATAPFERRGCGYREAPMSTSQTRLSLACRVIVKEAGLPRGRVVDLPLETGGAS